MVVVRPGHVGGTRGSGIVSSAADVLWMSVVRGMRGVGGVCEMCLARGGVGGEWVVVPTISVYTWWNRQVTNDVCKLRSLLS